VSAPTDPLVDALALAITAHESDLYWTGGRGNEGAVAADRKARLSAVLSAARAVADAYRAIGDSFATPLAERQQADRDRREHDLVGAELNLANALAAADGAA
jgi:hypothetical protein